MNYLSARFLVAVAECALEQKNEQLLREFKRDWEA